MKPPKLSMMNSLKINFESLRKGTFKGVFLALEEAFLEYGIDYYIIGAFARDLWLLHNKYLPDRRMTFDLDLAVYIGEWKLYRELKQYLRDRRWRLVLAILDGIEEE